MKCGPSILSLALLLLGPRVAGAGQTQRIDIDAVQSLLDGGQLEQAERQLRAALAERDDPVARNLLASVKLRQGQIDEAEAQLRSAAQNFDSVQALLQLAKLQARHGEHREAAGALRRAFDLAPNSEEVLVAYAKLSLTAAAPTPAIRALESLTRVYAEVAEHHYLLGVARLQIGESAAASEALQHALDLDPQRSLTRIALGLALNHQKRYAEAEEVLKRSLELDPDSGEVLAALAEAQAGLGKLEPAERHAIRALETGGAHPGALIALGTVRMAQQRYGDAREVLSKAVEIDPSSPKAHYQLSLAYARLDNGASAQRHIEIYRQALREAERALVALRQNPALESEGTVP